ncbi:hypothetical protein ONO57_25825, partial [Salmonella enterica subsp. enterica serovar Anatum]|nr:hypothetical protein [Salmonella enterica subsp. enterica serovar Anatum]
GFTCPKCGNHDAARVSVTRRVCGYLGSPDARPFNAGKQEEVKERGWYTQEGDKMAVFQLPFAKVGFNICYEAEIPECAATLAEQ